MAPSTTALAANGENGGAGGKGAKSVEDTYQKLTQLEHVLLRPDTYVGSAQRNTAQLWVVDDGSDESGGDSAVDDYEDGDDETCSRRRQPAAPGAPVMRLREVSYVPGLYKIFDEILVNAADHKQRDPSMDTLRVDIDPENNRVTVYNNGSGIPVEMHAKERCYVPELIFGNLLTSSNYDDAEKKVTGGRNGFGAKLANIFSTEFVVETADGRQRYTQTFRDNMQRKEAPQLRACSAKDKFTRISFRPDLAKFGMTHLDRDAVALMKKRVYDVAGCIPSVRVVLNGERLPIKSFKQYVSMYLAERPDAPCIHERVNDRWEVVISASDGQFAQVSFVNSIWTMKGGTHVNHVADQVVSALLEHVTKKNKGVKVKPFQVRNHLWVFVNCLVENPSFDSQTKENMTSRPSSFGSRCDVGAETMKKVSKSDIVGNVLAFAKFKQNSELKKTDGGKKQRVLGIPKLDDANKAGSREADKCTLILTEGDSAKALAISGLSVIGRDYYGVFPLRGKLLNVREAAHKQIMENAEINSLKKILGLQHGKKYDASSVRTLRYGHVMIMTDQDHDGSHIKGLLINFFHCFWPGLLEAPGFLMEFITPIVKVSRGKGARAQERVFFTLPEYLAWRREQPTARGWTIKYYKGLGTSTAAEAKDYFSHLSRHQLSFTWSGAEDTAAIELAFSRQKINERKDWLASHELGTYFDHVADDLTYSNFVHKELVLFSLADNARSIPCVMDGLKPSQRKVLFACFKRKLRGEIKVAQLAGYVSEHAAYHHGEMSLMATIVGLAQTFVGSNNINLLVPAGQFGTRLQGGKDAASARYIFTRLAPVARALFPEADDPLLNYLEEDGAVIEPQWYCPVVPMALVNGADGIGTGWSTAVPCYSMRDIIRVLRGKLRDDDGDGGGTDADTQLHPWYRGFTGAITPTPSSPGAYEVHGVVYRASATQLRVRELPLRTWTQPYKEWLDTQVISAENKGAFLREYCDNGTETSVDFTLTMDEQEMRAVESAGAHKRLRLSGSLSTNNMVLFDQDGKICRYESAMDILREFYGVRLAKYGERREWILSELSRDVERLENKVRFILAVVNGEIRVANRKRAELLAELKAKRFAPIAGTGQRGKAAGEKAAASDEEGDGEGDGGERREAADHGYDYLLSMALWSLTRERVDELCSQRDKKVRELEAMRDTKPSELWLHDLDELERVLDETERMEAEDAASLREAAEAARANQRRAHGGKKSRPQAVPREDADDLATLEEIPPPTPKQPTAGRRRKAAAAALADRPKSDDSALDSSIGGGGSSGSGSEASATSEKSSSATATATARATSKAAATAASRTTKKAQAAKPTKRTRGEGAHATTSRREGEKADRQGAAAPEQEDISTSLSDRLSKRLSLTESEKSKDAGTAGSHAEAAAATTTTTKKLFSASDYLASLKSKLGDSTLSATASSAMQSDAARASSAGSARSTASSAAADPDDDRRRDVVSSAVASRKASPARRNAEARQQRRRVVEEEDERSSLGDVMADDGVEAETRAVTPAVKHRSRRQRKPVAYHVVDDDDDGDEEAEAEAEAAAVEETELVELDDDDEEDEDDDEEFQLDDDDDEDEEEDDDDDNYEDNH